LSGTIKKNILYKKKAAFLLRKRESKPRLFQTPLGAFVRFFEIGIYAKLFLQKFV